MLVWVSEGRMSQSDKWAITRGSRELLLSATVSLLCADSTGGEGLSGQLCKKGILEHAMYVSRDKCTRMVDCQGSSEERTNQIARYAP